MSKKPTARTGAQHANIQIENQLFQTELDVSRETSVSAPLQKSPVDSHPENPAVEYYYDEVDAPAALLERVRAAAASRGEGRLNTYSAKKIMRDFGAAMSGDSTLRPASRRSQGWDPRVMGGYTGPGHSTRDPKPLGGIVGQLIRSRGWKEPVAVSSVLARWDQLMGAEIASHVRPLRFENSIVQVQCDSTAWATQLRLMQGHIVRMFERELGAGVVTGVRIFGPNNGRWASRGPKRASGGRGVRDTYG